MTETFLVGVRGESHKNPDNTSRQDIIRKLRKHDPVVLKPEPTNVHDRWAIAVLTKSGQQIGYLPSHAGNASAIFKGEPITAKIKKLAGGTNWFNRIILGKKYIGVVLKITKGEIDWNRFDKLTSEAEPYDKEVEAALALEKSGKIDEAVDAYKAVIEKVASFTEINPYASAHRKHHSPLDRLSLLLERKQKYKEALEIITDFRSRYDPIQPTKIVRDSIYKRELRLIKKL